jgi:hypothetical protein
MVDERSTRRKRRTSVLFRSNSVVDPMSWVLPTPFSQITYCEDDGGRIQL